MSRALFQMDPLLLGYLIVFSTAAIVCFGGLTRISRVDDRDTRVGLAALLATSGLWAVLHVGFLAAPTPSVQYGFFVAGLVVGLSTVGPWLYFCSAYTGRSYHRNRTLRRLAVGIYLSIVAVKVTNPFHGWYFAAEPATSPFPYLQIHHEPLHWIVMGLAYSLAFVGFFMLFELFDGVDFDTTALLGIAGLTGLPVFLDVIGATTPYLLDITYSALGVSAFTIGVLYVYFDRFQTIRLAGDVDDPVIVLDHEDHVRDFNRSARDRFPTLDTAAESPFEEALPTVADALRSPDDHLTIAVDGETRYYSVSENPFTAVGERLGRAITLSDVTETVRYRHELERQNARLERFASVVSHDLRNPLNVAQGRVDLAMESDRNNEHLVTTKRALDRMEALIEDILRLARLGRPIDATEPVRVPDLVTESWGMVETNDASLAIADGFDLTVVADPERLRQLVENLFRNAVEHGGSDVTVSVGALDGGGGFYVADDGPGIPEEEHADVFEFGYTTTSEGTGFGLAIVEEVVNAHGWSIRVTEADGGGARFEIRTS